MNDEQAMKPEAATDPQGRLDALVMCDDCGRPTKYCVCVYKARMETMELRVAEAVDEAYQLRRLWQAAASCLLHNHSKIKARGADEMRMLRHAEKADLGTMWAGSTDGWIDEPST
jgi:hypothetical protein